jgi:hypothetical protein
MTSVYSAGSWFWAACPTDQMSDFHRVLTVVRQRPEGASVHDVALAAGVDRRVIGKMITPPSAPEGHRYWPQMLKWVPGKERIDVQAIPCPHPDCPAPRGRRWATLGVYLPETAPDPTGIGAVMCPDCSRVPIASMQRIVFPKAWHVPVVRMPKAADQYKGGLTQPVDVPRVGLLPSLNAVVTIPQLVKSEGLTRLLVQEVMTRYNVPSTPRAWNVLTYLYDEKAARAALRKAFGPDGYLDRLAYGPTALSISDAARRAGVAEAVLKGAVEAGDLVAHRTRNLRLRFQIEDLDGWAASGG